MASAPPSIFRFLALALLLAVPLRQAAAQGTSIPRSCNAAVLYDASTNGATQLVPPPSGNQSRAGNTIFICGFTIATNAASTVGLVYGTGTNCGTGTTKITPAFAFAATTAGIASIIDDPGNFNGLSVPAGNNLCISVTGTTPAVQAIVYYDNNGL